MDEVVTLAKERFASMSGECVAEAVAVAQAGAMAPLPEAPPGVPGDVDLVSGDIDDLRRDPVDQQVEFSSARFTEPRLDGGEALRSASS